MAEKKKRRKRRYPKTHKDFLNSHRHLYETILEAQGGKCALCPRRPTPQRKLDMDHNHKTMALRGLLCVPCNRALRDWMDKEWLLNAIKHIDKDWTIE